MLPIKDNLNNELASYCTRTTKRIDGKAVITRECGYTFKKSFQDDHGEGLTIDKILPIKTKIVKFDECLTATRWRSNPVESYCSCSTHLCNQSNKIESLNVYILLSAAIVKIINRLM